MKTLRCLIEYKFDFLGSLSTGILFVGPIAPEERNG